MKKTLTTVKALLLAFCLLFVLVPAASAALDIDIEITDCDGPADDCAEFYSDGSIRLTSITEITITIRNN